MKTRRVISMLECVVMGSVAFDLMVVLDRIVLHGVPVGIMGLIVPTALGGAAGALVRRYFTHVEETGQDTTAPGEDLPDAKASEPPGSVLAPPVQETPEPQDSGAVSGVPGGTAGRQQTASSDRAVRETDSVGAPTQMELWPPTRDEDAQALPVQGELPILPGSMTEEGGSGKAFGDDEVRTEQAATAKEESTEKQFMGWFMDHAPYYCAAVNAQDEIVMANPALLRAVGYSADEVLGKGFAANLLAPKFRDSAWADLLAARKSDDAPFGIVRDLMAKDGREIPVQWHAATVFDSPDASPCCFLVGVEVAERVQPAKESVESEPDYHAISMEATKDSRRYRSALDRAGDAMLFLDLDGNATYANLAFSQAFGWTEEDLCDEKATFVPGSRGKLEKPILDGIVEKNATCKNLLTARRCKDGRIVSTRISASSFHDDAGQADGILIVFREITEQSRAEKEKAKPPAQPKKRQVNAKEILKDIRSGATDSRLMEKYKLTAKGLHSVFQKLVEAKALKISEMQSRSTAYDETVALDLHVSPSLEAPKSLVRETKPGKVSVNVRTAGSRTQGLDKFGITDDSLDSAFEQLVPQGVTEVHARVGGSMPTAILDQEDVTARRANPRTYMVVPVPIYEAKNLLVEGTIIDISESGMQVQGIDAVQGQTKSLLVQGDEFHDVFPIIFDAVCRWARIDEATGDSVAGFEITAISDASMEELRKLIATLSIGL